jgi:transposase
VDSKGFCFYKATNGIKRHLAVDTLGFPFFTHCTKANVSDDAGLIEMLTLNIDYFRSKPVHVPKITILLDHGYHIAHLIAELEKVYPPIMTKIRFQLSTKPSTQEKAAQGKSGFVPAVARWVIERANAWMERCKILVKNFERTLDNATTKINLCFVRRCLSGLLPPLEISNGVLYKARHLIENFFARLKQYRAIATRYDKRGRNFLGAIYLAAAVVWLN